MSPPPSPHRRPHRWRTWAAGLALVAAGATGGVLATGRLDATPPVVTLVAPTEPVRGAVPIEVRAVDASPGVATVHLRLDGRAPVEVPLDAAGIGRWTVPADPSHDGPHTVSVTAVDGSWRANQASAAATFHTDHTPPILQWAVVPPSPAQGEVAAVFVRSQEPVHEGTVDGLDQSRPLAPAGDTVWRGLLGVGVQTPAGAHVLTLRAADALGNRVACTVPLQITPTEFAWGGTIRLTTRQVAARTDTEALAQMRADRSAAYTHADPIAHWRGGALRPVPGRRTSAFGRFRAYSDGRKKHHLGTDLASPTGTPVHSALAGVVRAAGWQHLFGNAVIVHHGQGLTTSYNHLSTLDVELGQAVGRGQRVGTVGSTGQSTGPHLHWGMQVGEVEVDPERWPAHGFQLTELAEPPAWSLATDCTSIE